MRSCNNPPALPHRGIAHFFLQLSFYYSPLWVILFVTGAISAMRSRGVPPGRQAIILLAFVALLMHPVSNSPWVRSHSAWRAELRRWSIHVVDERLGTPLDAAGRAASAAMGGTTNAVVKCAGRQVGGGASTPRGVMYAFEPHAVFPFGPAFGAVHRLGEYLQHFKALGASIVGWIPVIRTLAKAGAGMVPVDRASIESQWRADPSAALGIVPGGIGEMFYADTPNRSPQGLPLDETLLLSSRKGFIRLALQQGASIVPIFVFGSSATFKLWPKWRWLRDWSRKVGMFLSLPYGHWGMPVPMKTPCFTQLAAHYTERTLSKARRQRKQRWMQPTRHL